MTKSPGPWLAAIWVALATSVPAVAQDSADPSLQRRPTASLQQDRVPRGSFPILRKPSAALNESADRGGEQEPAGKIPASLITVASSLAVVLGLFVGLIWLTRKFGSHSGTGGAIPKEVLQPLGSTAIDSRTRLTLVRCGNRIVVLAQSASGVQPITEITAPDEVHALTAACLGDAKQAFAATLKSLETERSGAGFLGPPTDAPTARARGRLFASA